jgi:hypothetical protein
MPANKIHYHNVTLFYYIHYKVHTNLAIFRGIPTCSPCTAQERPVLPPSEGSDLAQVSQNGVRLELGKGWGLIMPRSSFKFPE